MFLAKKTFFAVVFCGAIALAVALVFEFAAPKQTQKETITILRGENAFQIATDLKSEGYIKSKIIFLSYVLKTGNMKNLKSGVYDINGLGYSAIVDKLVRAQVVARNITIVPGWTVKDIAAYLEKEALAGYDDFFSAAESDFLKNEFSVLADLPADSGLEGYLYPDTYQIADKPSTNDIIRLMLENFEGKLTQGQRQEIKKQNKSVFEVVTMAAMIEKEVITLEDKKIVSGILWKRRASKMPLQVDSTLLYFKASENGKFDKEVDSPYNTYKYAGLPAGPICNPGLESIEAAIEPLDSPYWFYLSAKDGATIFSRTYDEHLANKAKYLDK